MSVGEVHSSESGKAESGPFGHGSTAISVIATLLIGVLLTIAAALWAVQGVRVEARFQFERLAEQFANEVSNRVQRTGYGLMGARDLYMGSEYVSRSEFRAFANSRNLEREFPGAIGLGVIERIARTDVGVYEMDERKDSASGYTVHGTNTTAELYPIKFIEPVESNSEALGYDLGAEPIRRAAVERAINTGEHTLTPPIRLVQDKEARTGLLYLVPVYDKGADPETPEERSERLVGLIFSPLVTEKLFQDLTNDDEAMLNVFIYDGTDPPSETLLYRSMGHRPAGKNSLPGSERRPRYSTVINKALGGRIWSIQIESTPIFERSTRQNTPLFALVLGGILTSMLSSLVWAFGLNRSNSFSLRLTQDLARSRELSDATYKADLESRLAARTRELEAIQEELIRKERMAVLGKLIATVSHELRNPLGTIRASLYLLKKRAVDLDSEFQLPIERAERNILRCDHIIEELLDYTRSTSTETTLTQVGLWLTELAKDFPFPDNVAVTTDFSIEISIPLDQASIRRCVVNVWQNACDALVTQKESARVSKLELTCITSRDRVEIITRDNGCGISSEDMNRIFAPLFTTKSFGVGLGLSIVSEILEAHDGGIEIESAPGEGTTVTLWLPRVTAP